MALVAALALTGCGAQPTSEPTDSPDIRTQEVELPDGRIVFCVLYDNGDSPGGISCDWEEAS